MIPRNHQSQQATTTLEAMIAERGYTQCRVATMLGFSPNTVYGWCRGLHRPWPGKAAKLARWLGVTTDAVMAAWALGAPTKGVSRRR